MQGSRLLACVLAAALASAEASAGTTDHTARGGHAYGHVDDPADLDRIFGQIRDEVGEAGSRAELTRLYRRAGYLVTLTYSGPWRAKFGADLPRLREAAKLQFKATAQAINRRAEAIGTDPDYADHWGDR
jgi:hypothetical protein